MEPDLHRPQPAEAEDGDGLTPFAVFLSAVRIRVPVTVNLC